MNTQPGAGAGAQPASRTSPPQLSLPRGGGAIRGVGEKFAATPVTGTGSFTVPIATSPGRSGFGPQLALAYDSGAGNGPFGSGWSLGLPSITRQTEKGVPEYLDGDESDVFILSGAEDLVPVLRADGTRWVDDDAAPGFRIHRYRPRVEGLFARIERWTERATGEAWWRTITRDNVTALYGRDNGSRVFDPADADPDHPTRVFSWLICASYDDRGNAMVYEYAAENGDGVDLARGSEGSRVRGANRYPRRIRYGNRVSRLVQPDLELADWMFEVVFDYGQGHYQELPPDPGVPAAGQHRFVRASSGAAGTWQARPDPFSSHRAGFEVRTHRRCRRVLMFHRFPELGDEPCLTRSTELVYHDLDPADASPQDELAHPGSTRFASFVVAAVQSGYVRDPDAPVVVSGGARYVTYLKDSLPPLEFGYSKAAIQEEVRELEPGALENLPAGVDGGAYRWVDLDGEGLSGILAEQANAWFYKRNLGGGRFGAVERLQTLPATAGLAGGLQLLDLAGDGRVELVALAGAAPGFFERGEDGGWEAFRAFRALPALEWNDPNLRFADLDGDGHADVLITGDAALTWHPSLGEDGFGAGRRVLPPADEHAGPRLVLADGTESIYLADMCGDGLADLVRIRNGEVCYWPSLGHGRFGPRVAMDNAPWFDAPGLFDQRRVRLADIDGSGTTDVIYLAHDGPRLYFNQSGNRLTDSRRLAGFPALDDVASVEAVDLLGNGTACLVWSSALAGDARRPLRYVDLMGGVKPHLLVRVANGLGAETHATYASSTAFYLEDRRAGRPWVTRLPFPVHVLARVETLDRVSRNRFVVRYAYHHGHYDGVEREFRGFGMVEQWDTEELAALEAGGALGDPANLDAASYVPPVLTRTWYHTGRYAGGGHVSDFFAGLLDGADAGEYYREPGLSDARARALLLDDTVLPAGLTPDEEREACRAMRGQMLRQEVYALDGSPRQPHPYTVTEQNFTVQVAQRRGPNRHGVFFTHPREALSYHYERDPADPRVSHALTFEVDPFGNVLRSAAVGYGRRAPDPGLSPADQAEQARTWITFTVNGFTNLVDTADAHRTPLPCETRTYELTGAAPAPGQPRLSPAQVQAAVAGAAPLAFELAPTPGTVEKRLVEHVRTLYRRDDLDGALPPGVLESRGLQHEDYGLALTPALVAAVYGGRVTNAMLSGPCAYVHSQGDADWWAPSGRVFHSPGPGDTAAQELAFARQHFFLPIRYREPWHTPAEPAETVVAYDAHDLLLREVRDAAGNRVTAGERDPDPTLPLARQGNDYRVLQPVLLMDANRNRSAVAYDAVGVVVATAVMGKPEDSPVPGDALDPGLRTNLTRAETDAVFAAPRGPVAAALLGSATSRVVLDLDAYRRGSGPAGGPPVWSLTLARETHTSEPPPAGGVRIQAAVAYSDGFGREIQKKVQAEPGPVPARGADGTVLLGADGRPILAAAPADPRWVGSGWTVFNNKGSPVRAYEPFFTDTHRFEWDPRVGVSPVVFYDPPGRVAATLLPDHTWTKTVFTAWRQETWDPGDTVLVADPAADPHAGGFFARLPATEYLPTWHARRDGGGMGPREQQAARASAVHADTPAMAHQDVLGRTFLTVAHNRFRFADTPTGDPPFEEFHPTRTALDVEGNVRAVADALDRVVVRYGWDLLGRRIHEASMDAGERWTLDDAAGRTCFTWDSRGHRLRTAYDALARPTGVFLREGAAAEVQVERTVYGEAAFGAPGAANLRGRVFRRHDQAGIVTTGAYDFKGNPLHTRRELAQSYDATLDWQGAVPLEAQAYETETRWDALGRAVEVATPDGSLLRPAYNEANLLETLRVNLRGELDAGGQPAWTPFVTGVEYDEEGRRTAISCGNGAATTLAYDPLTGRLAELATRRPAAPFPGDCPVPAASGWPGCGVQALHYTYDAAGNLTHLRDDAQQAVFFRNQRVDPGADYTYDALNRLIEATGREHLGQTGAVPHSYNDVPRVSVPHRGDGNAMRRYRERYSYDAAGNLTAMLHRGGAGEPGWTRTFHHEEPSLLQPALRGNRLSRSVLGAVTETFSVAGDGYDGAGNLLRMPQLQEMRWDFRDQLRMTRRQAVNAADADGVQRQGERTWYVYDASGQRVRKVTETAGGQVRDERVYLGGFEVYRRHGAGALVRETLHVMDGQQRVALVETRTSGSEPGVPPRLLRFQLGNHQGSAVLELDGDAQVVSYEEYTPYGSSAYQAVGGQTETPKRYRYTGKERDEESGLYYHGARYYAPWLARWTSPDPSGIDDGPNLYAYVSGDPVGHADPDGRQKAPSLDLHKGDIGRFKEADINAAIKTVYGELTRKPHAKTPQEARAIASTIFNRLTRIEKARSDYDTAKTKLTAATKKREAALKAHGELAKNEKKLVKELGEKIYAEKVKDPKQKAALEKNPGKHKAAFGREEFKKQFAAAQKAYDDATSELGKAQTKATEAKSALDAAEKKTIPDDKIGQPITLSDIVAQNSQYEGTKKGKKDFAAFPKMSETDQKEHEIRWNAARKAVEDLAKDPATADDYIRFVGGNLRPNGALKGEVKIGGNYFTTK
jgi:RHS repeat-associated protein